LSETVTTLLDSCTVKLVSETRPGTGFFVAADLILTAAHVVMNVGTEVQIVSDGQTSSGEVIHCGHPDADDIALVRTSEKRDFWVFLGSDCTLSDRFYTFGYPQDSDGESVTLDLEGVVRRGNLELLKLKQGQLVPGMSGAPLLNLRTGAVCGVVVVTRDRHLDLGGQAIATRTVLSTMAAYAQRLRGNPRSAAQWIKTTSPLAQEDLTTRKYHYNLFPHDDIDVVDIFIEPNFVVLHYQQLQRIEVAQPNFTKICLEILERQKILFLFGPYGSGKTVLTKVLQRILWDKGYDTAFFRCGGIMSNLDQLKNFVNARSADANPVLIALDGYDESNLLRLDKKDIKSELLQSILEISFKSQVYLIFNSRPISMNENSIYLSISMLMFDNMQAEMTSFVELRPFTKTQIDHWLDAYSNAKARSGNEHRLHRSGLSTLHKSLSGACANPLFLYMLAVGYYEGGMEDLRDIYSLYKSFVDKTVNGKFHFEQQTIARPIEEIGKCYRNFLRDMAVEISANNYLPFDSDQLDAWNLDPNTSSYAISYENVRGTVERTAAALLEPRVLSELDRGRLTSNVLTCYFLEEADRQWRFKDNNILFFLLAEVFLESLRAAVRLNCSAGGLAACFPDLLHLGRIPLHPLSLELLLNRLTLLEPEEKKQTTKFLRTLVANRQILVLWQTQGVTDSGLQLRIETLLALVFLKIYTESYHDVPLFFDNLRAHGDLVRQMDPVAYDIFRAFFRGLNVRGGVLHGYRFDGYNFQDSRFVGASFEHSAIIESALDHVCFEEVQFQLCKLQSVKAQDVGGSAIFELCDIDLEIKGPRRLSLKFDGCRIKNLHLYADRRISSKKITIILNDCQVENIILRKLDIELLDLRGGRHPILKLEGSRVKLRIVESNCTSVKKWQEDAQSKVELLE